MNKREHSASGEATVEHLTRPVSYVEGRAPAFLEVLSLARRLARSDLSLLLVGATGTGKEVMAREIHAVSARSGPFVDVNCAALPREMVEGILFGHRRGAFSGANADTCGLIEGADCGTLFLDELQSLAIDAQPKLLRVLESGEVRRIGEIANRRVRLRVVAAAQPSIGSSVAGGAFRDDLLQRIAGAVLRLPTLRERSQDIAPLARHYAAEYATALTPEAMRALQDYDWPGNIRELRLVVQRIAHLADGEPAVAVHVHHALQMSAASVAILPGRRSGPTTLKERVVAICAANDWDTTRAAAQLGWGRTTFFKRLKGLGISLRSERSEWPG